MQQHKVFRTEAKGHLTQYNLKYNNIYTYEKRVFMIDFTALPFYNFDVKKTVWLWYRVSSCRYVKLYRKSLFGKTQGFFTERELLKKGAVNKRSTAPQTTLFSCLNLSLD